MDQRTKLPRLAPLPPEHSPELKETFEQYRKTLGFVPNSMLILQRKPKIVKAMAQLTASVWEPDGEVSRALPAAVRPPRSVRPRAASPWCRSSG